VARGRPLFGEVLIAKLPGDRFDLDLYHVDDAFDEHMSRLDATRHPALVRWMASSWNERWMPAPAVLLREVIACYREHLGLILDDLRASASTRRRTLVEGSAILQAEIEPVLMSGAHAIWLLPAPAFQARHYASRVWVNGILRRCAEPAAAFGNWMERDAAFARAGSPGRSWIGG
jgi:hypothetical protein